MSNLQALRRNVHLKYNVLLILTASLINDIPDTKNLIVELSKLPISIFVIGIGNGNNLKALGQLDTGKHEVFSRSSQKQERDILRFLRLVDFENDVSKLC